MFVFLKSRVHDSMAVWTIETIICFTLSSFSTYVSLLNRYMKMGMHCVWHSGWMLKPCRSMLSPFPLMCWNKHNFLGKNGYKDHVWSAQTWQWPSDLFITLQHWLCWKNATQTVHLWQKPFKLTKKVRRITIKLQNMCGNIPKFLH